MGHASIRRIDNNKKLKGLLSPIGIYPLTPYKLIHPIGITPPRDTPSPYRECLPPSLHTRALTAQQLPGRENPSQSNLR